MSSETSLSAPAIKAKVKELRARIDVAEAELDRLRTECEWWERGLQFFDEDTAQSTEQLFAEAPKPLPEAGTNGARPTLRQAILAVLSERPNKTWKLEEILAMLDARDWMPGGKTAEHQVRSMVAEMARKGHARRVGHGRYKLPLLPKGSGP